MLVFEVSLNKNRRWVIGVPNEGVMSAELHFARRPNKKTSEIVEELALTLGGLEVTQAGLAEYLTWVTQSLSLGDEIVIRVSSADTCDPVLERRRDDPSERLEQKQRLLKELRAELGEG